MRATGWSPRAALGAMLASASVAFGACAASTGAQDADVALVDATADGPDAPGGDAGIPSARYVPTCRELVPAALLVWETRVALDVSIAGDAVRLLHLTYYRAPMNDPTFPLPSDLCGVEDARGCVLHSARWAGSRYAPTTIALDCPEYDGQGNGVTRPPCVPSGLRHPLTQAPEYAALVRADDLCIMLTR